MQSECAGLLAYIKNVEHMSDIPTYLHLVCTSTRFVAYYLNPNTTSSGSRRLSCDNIKIAAPFVSAVYHIDAYLTYFRENEFKMYTDCLIIESERKKQIYRAALPILRLCHSSIIAVCDIDNNILLNDRTKTILSIVLEPDVVTFSIVRNACLQILSRLYTTRPILRYETTILTKCELRYIINYKQEDNTNLYIYTRLVMFRDHLMAVYFLTNSIEVRHYVSASANTPHITESISTQFV
jgi:hypothetical protein